MKKSSTNMRAIRIFIFAAMFFASGTLTAQPPFDIFELMERRDLRLNEIDAIAKRHFDRIGRVRGTGYKQYERWKYEKQFHLDANGFILPDDYDAIQYNKLAGRMAADVSNNAVGGAWTELGPTYWNRTTSWNPGVGRITAIAVYPQNQNIIYVTSPGGGIWKSTQGGNQWVALADYNNSLMTLYSVAVHPTNPDIVFTGNTSGVIYKSTDGGSTWTAKSSGMGTVRKILINPNNPSVMFATGSGIWKSIDGGETWVRKITTSNEDIEFKPGNTNILYASGSNVFRSLNAGETWTQLTATNGITNSARAMIGVTPADSNVVYIVQANGSEFGRLYRSNDGGNSFITTITGSAASCTNFFGYSTNGCGTGGQATYDMAITVNPQNANDVHIAGIICFRSTNGGTSFVATTAWSLPNTIGYNHADVHVLEWVGNTIYSGSDGGIYKSTDLGDNWTDLSNGIGIRQFYRIANSKTNPRILTGGAQDNGSTVYKSIGWRDWLGADGMDGLISPLDSNLMWGTSQYGSLYRSTNGGSSYSNLPKPMDGNWVTPLAIESNSNVIYAGYAGVYKSTDNGSSWVKISDTIIKSNLSVLAVAPSNPAYIYASVGSTLYVTRNGGTSWSTYTSAGVTINSIAIHPTNPEKIWISSSSTTNRILVSINGGASFTNISSNLPSIAARSVVVDNTADEGLYAAMNLGVYYTNKNMTSWVNLTDNLPLVAINEVELQVSGGKVRAATYGRGAWERAIYNPCNNPTNLTTDSVTALKAKLIWTGSTGAVTYNVEYKATSSSTWLSAASALAQTSYTLTGLNQSTSYDWRVSAVCTAGSSTFSSASFTTTAACGTPSSLSSSNLTTNSATLNWNAVAGAVSYNVSYKTSASSTWISATGPVNSNSYVLQGLNEGTAYNWKVSATCTEGTGAESVTSQFTTPITCNAPSGLSSGNITANTATLSWSAVTGATGYDVEYKTTASSTWISAAANINALSYSLTGLSPVTAYDWRVRTNCGTLSGYSNYTESSLTTIFDCGTPGSLSTSNLTTSSVTLNWTAVSGALEYNLSYKTASSSTWIQITGPVTANSYDLQGLSEGAVYDWKVSATCADGTGNEAVSQFTTPITCNAPTGLSSSAININSATLSWTAVSGAAGYDVEYKTAAATTWTVRATNLNALSVSLTGLSSYTAYDWRVRSNCGALSGTSSYSSATFNTLFDCGTPGSLSTTNVTASSATLNWSAVAGASQYNVSYKLSSASSWIAIAGPVTTNSYLLQGLAAGSTYNWKVSATCVDGPGNEALSQFSTPVICNAPVTLTTTAIATTSATLNWTAVSGATGYDVEYKTAAATTWIVRSTNLNALTVSLTGLTASTAYNWRVRTRCGTTGLSTYNQTSFSTNCSDSYESNNSASASKAIAFNTEISATIGTSSDADWFKFTTPNTTATNLRLSLYNLPANYDLNLYNRSQVLLRSSANTGTTNEVIIYNSTAAKTLYYARVIGSGGAFSAASCYRLKVENSSLPYSTAAPGQPVTQLLTAEPVKEMTVFPVPARDLANVIYLSEENGRGELVITDASGKVVQTRQVAITEGENIYKLGLTSVGKGFYTIRLITGKKVITEKLIKN